MLKTPGKDFQLLMGSLKGGITPEEGALLYRLASETTAGCIIEVGSYRGKSAVALALGVRTIDEKYRPAIYCIDPHRTFIGFYGGEFGPQDRGAFYETMLSTGAFNEIALINLSSPVLSPGWNEPVGFAFIDGDHRYEGVKRDFECWDPHVIIGGKIAFDDATDKSCGPYQLIQEILTSRHYEQVATVGKITVLKKITDNTTDKAPLPCHRRLLVACDQLILSGGLLRFERVGNILRRWGHKVAFMVMNNTKPEIDTTLPVLSFAEAAKMSWDAVMVPGAGFPPDTIELFSTLNERNFGTRVQHILNDQSRSELFKQVNRAFKPHIVIFNNKDWPVGSFTDFEADRFYTLLGGIDPITFSPRPYRSHTISSNNWIVGGLANKNPWPLVDALENLPLSVTIRLFGIGDPSLSEKYASYIKAGRLELVGPILGENDLAAFYHAVDCIVMTETMAGWSNLVAEAMASGVPAICTRHGTTAFAVQDETALVIEEPTPTAIATALRRLMENPRLCSDLAENARKTIVTFSWDNYALQLLDLISHDGARHYISSPEDGLYGKWPLSERLQGLGSLLTHASGSSILDFGAAEGVVAREFLKRGASKITGFELDPERVKKANTLCSPWGKAEFRVADLSDWSTFCKTHGDCMQRHDIILYLGIHHHLPAGQRLNILSDIVNLASHYFAIRTPLTVLNTDGIDTMLARKGFHLMEIDEGDSYSEHLGPIRIYEKSDKGVAKP